jgi:hypothetical protein
MRSCPSSPTSKPACALLMKADGRWFTVALERKFFPPAELAPFARSPDPRSLAAIAGPFLPGGPRPLLRVRLRERGSRPSSGTGFRGLSAPSRQRSNPRCPNSRRLGFDLAIQFSNRRALPAARPCFRGLRAHFFDDRALRRSIAAERGRRPASAAGLSAGLTRASSPPRRSSAAIVRRR